MNPLPPGKKQTAQGSSQDREEVQVASTTSTASTMLPPPSAPAPLADNTPNAQGEGKPPDLVGAKGGGAFLPPPPPKKSGAVVSGAPKAAPTAGGSYRPPSWGLKEAPEASGLSLAVLKGGIEVNSISLDNRTHILLGRQQGVVDVLLEHPSISRKHAILQHGQNGALFLFDNGSTHGCTVNKKKIPPKEFHRLHVGDVLKFGESTRLYALEGPEELRPAEYESDNLRNLRLDAGRKQLAAKLAKLKAGAVGEGKGGGDSGEYGISWGFDEDAVAEEEDEDDEGMEGGDDEAVELPDYLKTEAQKRRRRDTKIGLTEDSVHKRDAKLFEKLQLKLTKVEHLLTENERITAKEGGQGGLTEGQQAQLARNDKAITAVRLQIEEIEETIRQKNKARERGKEREEGDTGKEEARGGKEKGDRDEDDDYYDRTAPVVPVSARAAGSDPASKKAEIRARRFGGRDNKSKMTTVAPGGGGGGGGVAAAATTVGGGAGDDPVAQSLEALTRRAEVVAEDLERTQAGLVELEAEEAEEAGEAALNDGEGGGAAADPLDMFMTENRRKERNQATLRLTTQRDALLKEQARLKIMVEAARPSMPTLKASATAKATASSAHADAGGAADEKEEDATTEADDKSDTGGAGSESTGAKAGQGHAERGQETKGVSPPPPAPATAAAPATTRPGQTASPLPVEAMQEERKPKEGTNGGGGMPAPPEKEEKRPRGAKRRGTPVGASMLPPPPAKRPQRRETRRESVSSAPPGGEGEGGGASPPPKEAKPKPKRTVKGPAAMPPSSGIPSAAIAGAALSPAKSVKSGGAAAGGAGKDVLEGGDVDWVPPKDALAKMAALNQKFGY